MRIVFSLPANVISLVVVASCFAANLPSPRPTYITRYDYLDIDKILTNERILRRLLDCIVDRGPCTREGKELKRIIPDALRTSCSKCNERQKMNTGRALAYLLHYKPEYWSELVNRFDQDGSFRRKLNIDSDDAGQQQQSTSSVTKSKKIDSSLGQLPQQSTSPPQSSQIKTKKNESEENQQSAAPLLPSSTAPSPTKSKKTESSAGDSQLQQSTTSPSATKTKRNSPILRVEKQTRIRKIYETV